MSSYAMKFHYLSIKLHTEEIFDNSVEFIWYTISVSEITSNI